MTDTNTYTLELSRAQVNSVVQRAVGDDGLLASLVLMDTERLEKLKNNAAISHSLVRGLTVFSCFNDGEWKRGTDIAAQLRLQMSTTHRYVTTLTECGLLERNPVSREYRLAVEGGVND